MSKSPQSTNLKATSGNSAKIVVADMAACKSYMDVVNAVLLTSEVREQVAVPKDAPQP